ncbi:hypothetical protein H1S01_07780 [Heliobacterium chlorum]|uniref:SHOCT domain-containing protein n=1 Tax=Heliobacterium chlorum TaxID=2698 RepID=A0ABR7T251_HELCL|nr:hypothetical protein [Heliobacterium chlorum]MBC9784410.1 hypothetical protein [Heliobacterium chlorum]
MRHRGRVKPSKSQSLIGFIGGFIFVLIGLFVVIPIFGPFGVFWTLIAVLIAGINGYNAFSDRGTAFWEVEFEQDKRLPDNEDFDQKLRKLESLKKDGLLNEDEYQQKRTEILKEKW